MPVIKNCLTCGKEIKVKPSHVDRKKYCSKDCMYSYKAQNGDYKKEHLKTGKYVKCAYCKKEFYRQASALKEGNNFCSKECVDLSKTGRPLKEEKLLIAKKCLTCGNDFSFEKWREKRSVQFCSVRCRAIHFSSKQVAFTASCDYCGKVTKHRKSTVEKNKHKFCSKICNDKHRAESPDLRGENSPHWSGGKESYGANWRQQRRACRVRENYTCKDCGITEEEYGQELSVHHIVPFKFHNSYKEANKLDNLVAICEPCHRIRHSGDNHPTKYKKYI